MSLDTIDRYTPNDVFRTAFVYLEDFDKHGLAYGLKHGINEVCVACKAGSTFPDGTKLGNVARITNAVDLKPWSDFYKTKDYAAYKCYSCGYQWSWYRERA